MADNLTLNTGTGGDTIKADDISGVKIPGGKTVLGDNNTDGGYVSKTNPMPAGVNTVKDGSGTEYRILCDADGHLQVDVLSAPTIAVTGTFYQATQPISAASLPLPTGASTAANQSTGNTSLGSIDTKTPALGQALAAGSVPVVLPAAQITTLTPPAAITGFATETKQDTANTALTAIQTAVETLDNAIAGNEMQVDIVSGTVTVMGAAAPSASFYLPVRLTSGVGFLSSLSVTDNGGSLTVDNDGTFAVQVSSGTVTTVTTLTGSSVAHDAADSGNPHKVGAKAIASLSGATLVAAADRTDLYAGVDGVLITRPHSNLEDIVSGNANNTDGTSTSLIAAQGAGIKTYLTTIILTNTSASNIYVEIKDGTTVKLTIPVPANSGAVVNLTVPLGGTANTAWNFDPSAATTTVYCSAVGFKSKV